MLSGQSKFIVWDWNGTLLDDVGASHEANNDVLHNFQKPLSTVEEFREHFDMPITTLYRNMGFSNAEIDQNFAVMQTVFHDSYEKRAAHTSLREGAMEVLAPAQKSFVSLILSNHLISSITHHLSRLAVGNTIHHVIAYESRLTQFDMPKGERLRLYMEEKKLAPENILIVGDTPEEAHIARDLGLTSIAVTGGYASQKRLEAVRPDHLIHSLHELKPILQERGFA